MQEVTHHAINQRLEEFFIYYGDRSQFTQLIEHDATYPITEPASSLHLPFVFFFILVFRGPFTESFKSYCSLHLRFSQPIRVAWSLSILYKTGGRSAIALDRLTVRDLAGSAFYMTTSHVQSRPIIIYVSTRFPNKGRL